MLQGCSLYCGLLSTDVHQCPLVSSAHDIFPPHLTACQYLLAVLGGCPPGRRKINIRFSALKNDYSTSPSQIHTRAWAAPASVRLPVSLITSCISVVYNAPACLLGTHTKCSLGSVQRGMALRRETGGSPDLSNLCKFDP